MTVTSNTIAIAPSRHGRRRWLGASILACLALPAFGSAPTAPAVAASSATVTLQAVTVSGEQPGPGLWKVSKGDHVLWVLGTLPIVPQHMQWQAREVQTVIAQSQEVLQAPQFDVDAHIGFFGKLALLPSLIGLRNNPDGRRLQDEVSPPVYAQWLVLKAKYLGHDSGVEKQRPIFAALTLFNAALDHVELTYRTDKVIDAVIARAARQHGIEPTQVKYTVELDDPRVKLKAFKATPIEDSDCFGKTLIHLEYDIGVLRARANAWAVGDLDQLQRLPIGDEADACRAAITESGLAKKLGVADLPGQLETVWVAAAEQALQNHTISFSELPMDNLLGPDRYHYLDRLQAWGARIDLPDGLTAPTAPAEAVSH